MKENFWDIYDELESAYGSGDEELIRSVEDRAMAYYSQYAGYGNQDQLECDNAAGILIQISKKRGITEYR